MLHRIKQVTVHHDHVLRLDFDDGKAGLIDISPFIAQGGVWSALSDAALFARVSLAPDGRYIEWPNGIDLCADALRLEIQDLYRHAV